MNVVDQAKKLIGIDDGTKEWYEELEEEMCSFCPALTWSQRLGGCAVCFTIGLLLSFGSLFRLIELIKGDPVPFALMYTLGNIIGICSTCFLYGPWAQAKKMAAPTRFIATVVYLSMMVITLFLVFYEGEIPLRLMLIVFAIALQFTALVWYTLSFIPFAREIVSQMCCKCNEGYSWV